MAILANAETTLLCIPFVVSVRLAVVDECPNIKRNGVCHTSHVRRFTYLIFYCAGTGIYGPGRIGYEVNCVHKKSALVRALELKQEEFSTYPYLK